MFIRAVDEALEKLVRERLPLPEELGDVSFDPPTGTWAAQLGRITVNFFLYGVTRSSNPARSTLNRMQDGRAERRAPQPIVDLSYLVSAWAGSPREEHQLLGDLISMVTGLRALPEEYFKTAVNSSALVDFDVDEANKVREIWGALGGQLKGSFLLRVGVATDTHDWAAAPPAIDRVEALTAPHFGGVKR